jgi:hypothetical protein
VGALALPASGTVYLDANGFIYSIERIDPLCRLLGISFRIIHRFLLTDVPRSRHRSRPEELGA